MANNIALSTPSSSVTSYKGIIHRAPRVTQLELSTQVINYDVAVTATAAGLIDFGVSTGGPSVGPRVTATDWSVFSGAFSHYRVLGVRVSFLPCSAGASANGSTIALVQFNPFYCVTQIDNESSVAAYANIVQDNSLRMLALNEPFAIETRMNRTLEASFIPVGNDFTQYKTIKIFSAGLTPNVIYGRFHVWWRIEYEHRQ